MDPTPGRTKVRGAGATYSVAGMGGPSGSQFQWSSSEEGAQFDPNPSSYNGGYPSSLFSASAAGEYPIHLANGTSSSNGGTIAVISADLQADGVGDEDEEDPGAFLVAHGPRHRVQLNIGSPPAVEYMKVVLTTNFYVELWTDEEGGDCIYDPETAGVPYCRWDNIGEGAPQEVGSGWDNWEDLPSEVWVQPLEASSTIDGVPLSLSFTGWAEEFSEGPYVSGSQGDAINLVVVDVTEVSVHNTDDETAKIASVLGAGHLDHFVTAKDQGDVVLVATTEPDDPAVGGHLIWTAEGVNVTSPAVGDDKRTMKFSSATQSGLKAPLKIEVGGAEAWHGMGWVVWVDLTPDFSTQTTELDQDDAHQLSEFTPVVPHLGLSTPSGWFCSAIEWKGEIFPKTIITDDDRPHLDGALQEPGANAYWDMSRERKRRFWVDGVETDTDNPVQMLKPELDWVSDNHDFGDEDDNPYDGPRGGGNPTGKIFSFDAPSCTTLYGEVVAHAQSTFEWHRIFREWARIYLGGQWYRCSEYGTWRSFRSFHKVGSSWEVNAGGTNVIDATHDGW